MRGREEGIHPGVHTGEGIGEQPSEIPGGGYFREQSMVRNYTKGPEISITMRSIMNRIIGRMRVLGHYFRKELRLSLQI